LLGLNVSGGKDDLELDVRRSRGNADGSEGSYGCRSTVFTYYLLILG
jgi:hypothetical protein